MNNSFPRVWVVRTLPHQPTPVRCGERELLGTTLHWGAEDQALEELIRQMCAPWERVVLPPTGNVAWLLVAWAPVDGYAATTGYVPTDQPVDVVLHHPGEGVALIRWGAALVVLTAEQIPSRSELIGFSVEALIKRPPLYQVHAAAVEKNGAVALLVAESGVGKSLLATLLTLAHGCRYLGDDAILIDGRTLELIGMPWRLELRPEVLPAITAVGARIPDSAVRWKRSRRGNERKMVLEAAAVFGDRLCPQGSIRTVAFLERADRFSWKPLTRSAAARRLRPIPLFGGRRRSARGWSETFARLAEQASFFQVGIDHQADPRENALRLDQLLWTLSEG